MRTSASFARPCRDRGAAVSQGQYVALAYGVVLVFVVLWVAIIATKLARLERETGDLAELARGRPSDG